MSRITLTRYPSGQERVVVGWDHPCGGAFWQEFREEPADGDFPDDFEEMLREGGFFKGIPLDSFRSDVPEDLRPLITDEVMRLLYAHSLDPDSGYNKPPVDLSERAGPTQAGPGGATGSTGERGLDSDIEILG